MFHYFKSHHSFIFKYNSKQSACNAEDLGAIPGLGKSAGGEHGNPLQYSCLENPHGQRILVGYSALGSQRIRHDWSNLALIIQVTLRDYHNLPSLLKSNFLDCSSNGLISLLYSPIFSLYKKKAFIQEYIVEMNWIWRLQVKSESATMHHFPNHWPFKLPCSSATAFIRIKSDPWVLDIWGYRYFLPL